LLVVIDCIIKKLFTITVKFKIREYLLGLLIDSTVMVNKI